MSWCFAIVNGRLAEMYFEKRHGKTVIFGHAYVKKSDFKTIREKRYIVTDTKKCRFSYRKETYTDLHTGEKVATSDMRERTG